MNKIKRILIILLSILTFGGILGMIPACKETPKAEPETKSGPKFVAHRGYSQEYVDNTEDSFRAAAKLDFYGIETDIRKSKDGYIICNHDATVKYADGSELTIAQNTRAELTKKSLKNDKTDEDVYLCTFESYLRACKEGNKVAVIELKDYFNTEELYGVLEIIDNEYDIDKVTFISFSYAPLLSIKKIDPTIELQYLSQTENDPKFENCLSDGISIDIKETILTEELVRTFHDANLKVNVWTVDDEEYLELARAYGVDYVTTNLYWQD